MNTITDKIFDEIISYLTDEGWQEAEKDQYVTIYTKQIGGGECVKSVGILENCTPDQIFQLIKDCELRKKISENLAQVFPIEEGEDHDIIYQEFIPNSRFVSNRDMVIARRWKKLNDGTIIIVMKSIEHSKYPAKSNPVRAQVVRQAVSFKPIENGKVIFTQINQMDLNGYIPSSVANYVLRKMPSELVNKLGNALKLLEQK
jgi:hypothetical protein